MAVSTKFSKSGVCVLLGVLGAAGAQSVACSAPFRSCYTNRTCAEPPKGDAGAAGEEAGGASGGATPSAGASGSERSGAGGVPGASGAEEAGGSGEAGEGGMSGAASGGTSAAGTANGGAANGGAGAGAGGVSGGGGAGAGAGAGGAPVTCNACANGFACSTTTCKTTCSVDADCLGDHFCSSGQCRLDAVQVSIGKSHACVLLADKTVSCWGKNDLRQLGTASAADSATPVPVKFLPGAQSVTAGDGNTLALLHDGTVVFWGKRYTAYSNGVYSEVVYQYPTALEGLSAVKQIAAGGRSNGCATLADGSVRCWGINDWGQLGNGTWDFSAGPVVVSGVNDAVSIGFGYSFACAQTPGAVKCWGDNLNGHLGNFPNSISTTPQAIAGLSGTVSKLRIGGDASCVLMTSGSIQCWGVVNGATEATPVTVSAIPGVTDLTDSCALLSGGTVRCWGYIDGNTTGSVTAPTTVQGISGAVAIAAGGRTTCAILSNGSVKCWGNIIGDSTDYAGPTTVW